MNDEHLTIDSAEAARRAANWAVTAETAAKTADNYRSKADRFARNPSAPRTVTDQHWDSVKRADAGQQRAVAMASMWAATAAALHAAEGTNQ
ncbi:hypothetical protein [Streptomyces sp. NPDC059994]|uniref:hypothetical protein n=1 Tax=Streptomyces sp. NPDC059994 TaxID=3347029 RepID=UPI00367E3E4B